MGCGDRARGTAGRGGGNRAGLTRGRGYEQRPEGTLSPRVHPDEARGGPRTSLRGLRLSPGWTQAQRTRNKTQPTVEPDLGQAGPGIHQQLLEEESGSQEMHLCGRGTSERRLPAHTSP